MMKQCKESLVFRKLVFKAQNTLNLTYLRIMSFIILFPSKVEQTGMALVVNPNLGEGFNHFGQFCFMKQRTVNCFSSSRPNLAVYLFNSLLALFILLILCLSSQGSSYSGALYFKSYCVYFFVYCSLFYLTIYTALFVIPLFDPS